MVQRAITFNGQVRPPPGVCPRRPAGRSRAAGRRSLLPIGGHAPVPGPPGRVRTVGRRRVRDSDGRAAPGRVGCPVLSAGRSRMSRRSATTSPGCCLQTAPTKLVRLPRAARLTGRQPRSLRRSRCCSTTNQPWQPVLQWLQCRRADDRAHLSCVAGCRSLAGRLQIFFAVRITF